MDNLLAEQKTVSSDCKHSEKMASVESLKAQMKLGTEGSPADKLLKDLLATEEAALGKAKKGAPTADVLACALKIVAEN